MSPDFFVFVGYFWICCNVVTMDAKLAKVYYSPQGYWKGIAAIKKLADAASTWLVRQALWQVYLPSPRHIPRPKFDAFSPNAVHQAATSMPLKCACPTTNDQLHGWRGCLLLSQL